MGALIDIERDDRLDVRRRNPQLLSKEPRTPNSHRPVGLNQQGLSALTFG
jgi:hypothetical protein